MSLATFYPKVLAVSIFTVMLGCSQPSNSNQPAEPKYEIILPGDGRLNTALLADHTIVYEKSGGKMTVAVSRETIGRRNFITTKVWFNRDVSAPNPDTVRHTVDGMSFYSRRFGDPDVYLIDVKFDDNRFTGSLTPGPESDYSPVAYDKAYPHGGFEPAIIFNAIRTLPLEEGFTASIPVFDLNDGSQMFWSNIEVVGAERIQFNGRAYNTLKVISDGIRRKTMWFAEGIPYPLQMATKGSPGLWKASAQ